MTTNTINTTATTIATTATTITVSEHRKLVLDVAKKVHLVANCINGISRATIGSSIEKANSAFNALFAAYGVKVEHPEFYYLPLCNYKLVEGTYEVTAPTDGTLKKAMKLKVFPIIKAQYGIETEWEKCCVSAAKKSKKPQTPETRKAAVTELFKAMSADELKVMTELLKSLAA